MLFQGNDPSCLREFLLQFLSRNSPSGNPGLQVFGPSTQVFSTFSVPFPSSYENILICCHLQILDRNWGAGWNLLSLLLATKPSKRVRYNCYI